MKPPAPAVTEQEIRAAYDTLHGRGALRESERHYRWALRVLGPRPEARLLDVACGAGDFLRAAAAADLRVTGIDVSAGALAAARRNAPGAALCRGDGEALPFGAGVFDFVVNLGGLEHFLDPTQGVREAARVLRPDGRALFLLPNSYFLMTLLNVWRTGATGRRSEQPIDRRATRAAWTRLLEENGLAVLRTLKYNYRARHAPLKYKAVRPFIPLNLSYCFLFVCAGGGADAGGRP